MERKLIKKLIGYIAVPGNFEGEPCYDYKKMKQGQILCLLQATPFQVEAISKAKGIIVERPGLVQHATILAREFDVPCVVGAKDITKIKANYIKVKKIEDFKAEIELYK